MGNSYFNVVYDLAQVKSVLTNGCIHYRNSNSLSSSLIILCQPSLSVLSALSTAMLKTLH